MDFFRRVLDGMHDMGTKDTGLDEMGMSLPDGAAHFKCSGDRQISYENQWMLPMAALLMFLVPYGWLLRMDGVSKKDTAMRNKGYRVLAVCFLIGLIFLIFEDGINHAPLDQLPYSNKIVYACFITLIPLFIFARDFGNMCNISHPDDDSANCLCARNRGPGYCSWFIYGQMVFWEYGMMGLASAGVGVSAFWSSLSCHDVQIELGHWVPFLGYMAYAGILLYFSGKRKMSLEFQYAEGWMWISWGLVFNLYFMPGSGGGLFYPYFHNGEVSPRWSPDQQHIFQAAFYLFAGAGQIAFARMGKRSGFPILLLGWNMYNMLTMHPQYCVLAKLMHELAGNLFFAVGLLRFMDRIVEASLLMAMLAGGFVNSTNCSVVWGDEKFETVSYRTVVVMFWGTWWMYCMYLFKEHWEEEKPLVEDKSKYAQVSPVDEEVGQ